MSKPPISSCLGTRTIHPCGRSLRSAAHGWSLVIAPDFPSFGFTAVPDERKYQYTFESLTGTVEAFVNALHVTRYAIYVFDHPRSAGAKPTIKALLLDLL